MLKDTLIQEVDIFLLKPMMVSKYQFLIMHHITEALKGQRVGKDARMNLMKGVLHGGIQTWIGVTGPEDARRIIGMVFTTVGIDPYRDVRELLVCGLNLKEQLAPEAITKCLETLYDYARKRGCVELVARTEVHGVARLLEKHGWTSGQLTLTKEL